MITQKKLVPRIRSVLHHRASRGRGAFFLWLGISHLKRGNTMGVRRVAYLLLYRRECRYPCCDEHGPIGICGSMLVYRYPYCEEWPPYVHAVAARKTRRPFDPDPRYVCIWSLKGSNLAKQKVLLSSRLASLSPSSSSSPCLRSRLYFRLVFVLCLFRRSSAFEGGATVTV